MKNCKVIQASFGCDQLRAGGSWMPLSAQIDWHLQEGRCSRWGDGEERKGAMTKFWVA